MHPLSYYRTVSDSILAQLQLAATGQRTSFAYASNPLPTTPIVPNNTPFQVIIIGGTYLHVHTVQRQDKKLQILTSAQQPVPQLSSSKVLMQVVDEVISTDVSAVAVNFAFPMDVVIRDDLIDGRLICGTKDHTFEDMIGSVIGQEIEQEMQQRRGQALTVSVCNDTVALGFAALDRYSSDLSVSRLAAGVVGTGFNFGVFTSATEFVNLESGNFADFPRTQSAKQVDAYSKNPGKQLFEKEVGGQYLWQHFNIQAEAEGIDIRLSDTEKLHALAESDPTRAGQLAMEVFTHAASMVAAEIAALNIFSQEKTQSYAPFMVVIEGSVYWRAHDFADTVQDVLSRLTPDPINIVYLKNSGVTGTARLLG